MNTLDENCKDMKELLSAYRDLELDDSDRSRVEAHLGTCAACRDELAAVNAVVTSLNELPPARLERDFADDIEALIARSQTTQPSAEEDKKIVKLERKSSRGLWIAAAAAVALFAVTAAYLGIAGGGGPITPTVAHRPQMAPVGSTAAQKSATVIAENKTPMIEHTTVAVKQPEPKPQPVNVETVPKQIKQPPALVAKGGATREPAAELYVDDLGDNEALVALYDSDDDDYFDGISTDEDGLYAIKM